MFGQDTLIGYGPVDVSNQDGFVVCQELPESLIRPVVHELLPRDFVQEFVWVVHDEWQLDMFCEVPSFFDSTGTA